MSPCDPSPELSHAVSQLLQEIANLEDLPYPKLHSGEEDEDAFARRLERKDELLLALVQIRCRRIADVAAKLNLLSRRLREDLDPDDSVRELTYLLAESARDALHGWLALQPHTHRSENVAEATTPPSPAGNP